MKGALLRVREGLVVVPYAPTRHGWDCVVVESDDTEPNRAYPVGGYNIHVFQDEIDAADRLHVHQGQGL